ncbi:MAG: sugar phosphate isomerase/epimerase [Candidatus Solibacter sp.]
MALNITRRHFVESVGLATGLGSSVAAWAQKKRDLNIGHTGITWVQAAPPRPPAAADGAPPAAPPPRPAGPRPVDAAYIETIFKDVSGLGYYGLELFSFQIQGMVANGGLEPLIEKYKLPMISAYGGPDLLNAAKRTDSIAECIEWGKTFKKCGGKVVVIGPNGVRRDSYVFKDHKDDIVTTLNEYGKQLIDIGLTGCLHQHTGTCIESKDETYAIMESVDTRYVKFGPDIGQLQKGGVDPVQVVKDFLPAVHHMHLKDFNGGQNFVGYCPLGQGKVNIPAILDMMDGRKIAGMVMVELDGDRRASVTALETATIARDYLVKQGVSFRRA